MLLCYCNFMQKIRKFFLCIAFETCKTSFQSHFRPPSLFVSNISKQDFFKKNSFMSTLSLYRTVTLCQKSEKFWVSIFHETGKNLILSLFWTILAQKTPKTRFFVIWHPSLVQKYQKVFMSSPGEKLRTINGQSIFP